MITESTMYWITRLDAINTACSITLIVSAVCAFLSGMAVYADHDYEQKKCFLCSLFAAFISGLALVFVPTTKEMAMIYTVPAITRSDFVQKDLPDLYDMGIKALKEQPTTTDKDK